MVHPLVVQMRFARSELLGRSTELLMRKPDIASAT